MERAALLPRNRVEARFDDLTATRCRPEHAIDLERPRIHSALLPTATALDCSGTRHSGLPIAAVTVRRVELIPDVPLACVAAGDLDKLDVSAVVEHLGLADLIFTLGLSCRRSLAQRAASRRRLEVLLVIDDAGQRLGVSEYRNVRPAPLAQRKVAHQAEHCNRGFSGVELRGRDQRLAFRAAELCGLQIGQTLGKHELDRAQALLDRWTAPTSPCRLGHHNQL